jgi:hypothetical protein
MRAVLNFLVVVAAGVMLADAITHKEGTETLFNGFGKLWQISVDGMLGQTSSKAAANTKK